MRAGSDAEIRAYVATGEPLDKAGAYAAQGEGRRFIERIVGSESNVIGLPLEETLALLRAVGLVVSRPA
jgi:septum formation protein